MADILKCFWPDKQLAVRLGREFEPMHSHTSFVEIDEIIAEVILFLPLIQEGQLSVTSEGIGSYC